MLRTPRHQAAGIIAVVTLLAACSTATPQSAGTSVFRTGLPSVRTESSNSATAAPTASPRPSRTPRPTPSAAPSARELAAPISVDDLVSEIIFRSSLQIDFEEFADRWNENAPDDLAFDPAAVEVVEGSFQIPLGSHGLLGFVNKRDEVTAVAFFDLSNAISNRLERATAAINAVGGRMALVNATEPGLSFGERAALHQEIIDSITGDDFFNASDISHAATRDGVIYYLVSTTDDILVLAAVGNAE